MVKPRKPVVALLLSFFPGLGQIYNGQLKKGLTFLLLDILFPIVFGLTGMLLEMSGLVIALAFGIIFFIYRIVDGYIVARRRKNYELKAYNKWYFYLLFILAISVIRVFLDFPTSTGIQTFKIPNPSMSPTIQPGDRVVAALNAYSEGEIEYGDIVIFSSPKGGIWTFRVVGLPMDSIEIIDGKVYINGQLNEISKVGESVSDDGEVVEFEETLENNKKIKTWRFKDLPYSGTPTMHKKLVPMNEYFLMGDNRDNAFDSRFIGTIRKEDILGRVIYSYWGSTTDRINIDLRLE